MVLFTFFITSCSYKETMVINEDGSGVISFTIDASEMLSLSDSLASANDSIMYNSFGIKMGRSHEVEGRQEEFLSFGEFFEDEKYKSEIEKMPKEERDLIMQLKNLNLKTVTDKAENESTYSIVTNFNNTEEVYDMIQGMNYIFATGNEGSEGDDFIPYMWNNNIVEFNYFYDGKMFVKKVIPVNEPTATKNSTFNMFPYTVSYSFPKEIKYVSNKDAIVSDDKKTITITYNLEEYVDNVEEMSLQVGFE